MVTLEDDIKKAQALMRSGYWDAADDLLEQVISKARHLNQQVDRLKAENKQHKATIKQMDRRIMKGQT